MSNKQEITMEANKKIKKGSHPVRPSHPVRKLKLPAYYSQVLEKWTKLVKLEKGHGVERLVNTKTGRAEYRMVINGKLVSLEMLDGEDQGRNSFVYLVKTHGFTSEAILKHFMTDSSVSPTDSSVSSSSVVSSSSETKEPNSERQHTYRTEPIVEARLQKYAHGHGLAPAVFAFNEVAMISEKCFAVKFEVPQCSQPRQFGRGRGVKVGKEMRLRQMKDSILQEWFNEKTKKLLKLINTMYKVTGMYNTDPNEGNYMLDGNDKLIQIDYGGNRFDKKKSFDTFAKGFVKSKRMDLQKQLLFQDGTKYPPYYYWFTQKLGGTTIQKMLGIPTIKKLKGMNKGEWEGMFIELKNELDKNCNRIKVLEEDNDTSDNTAFFVQHIVRKF